MRKSCCQIIWRYLQRIWGSYVLQIRCRAIEQWALLLCTESSWSPMHAHMDRSVVSDNPGLVFRWSPSWSRWSARSILWLALCSQSLRLHCCRTYIGIYDSTLADNILPMIASLFVHIDKSHPDVLTRSWTSELVAEHARVMFALETLGDPAIFVEYNAKKWNLVSAFYFIFVTISTVGSARLLPAGWSSPCSKISHNSQKIFS